MLPFEYFLLDSHYTGIGVANLRRKGEVPAVHAKPQMGTQILWLIKPDREKPKIHKIKTLVDLTLLRNHSLSNKLPL
jgi:hypothetical protein